MNLRNVLFPAVFFSLGIAFAVAEEPADENTRRETTYLFGDVTTAEGTSTYARFFYDSAEYDASDMTRFGDGSARSENGRNDYSDGYKKDDIIPRIHAASYSGDAPPPRPPAESDSATNATAPQTASSDSDGSKALRFYDFSISFDDCVSEEIGLTRRNDGDEPLFPFEVVVKPPDISLLSDNAYSFFAFEKNTFTAEQNRAQLLSGNSYTKNDNEESIFDIISSLFSIPFALVSIAVCSGLILVGFTSAGKNSNY